jgi:hypothetical protein
MAKSKLLGDVVRTLPRRMVGDMPMRTDAILDPQIFTSIVRTEAPSSVFSFFGRAVGDFVPRGMDQDNSDPWFQIQASGLAASYINIKEEMAKQDPLRVIDNSQVPAVIPANVPFQLTLDRGWLDEDENFLCKDGLAFGSVRSRRIGANSAEYTMVLSGMPGETFSASLFSIGSPIIFQMGNSQGEGSHKSNTMPGDTEQYNTFFNPMMITRYVLPVTGSFMADEMYILRQQAMDGTVSEVNTGLPRKWLRKVLMALDKQMLYSRSNFDPKTKQILGRNNNSRYPERPTYAGFYQMMDQAPVQYLQQFSGSLSSGLQKIDRIVQSLASQPGAGKVFFAMAQGPGYEWLKRVIREAGMEKTPIQITVNPDREDKIAVGWALDSYVTDYGRLYIYDVGKSMAFSGEMNLQSYNGVKGGPRSNEIYFFPGSRSEGMRPTTKIAKYYSKEGQVEGFGRVNRGFVFGVSKGITGEGTGWTGGSAQQLQDSAIEQMMNSPKYFLNSLVDGNEYHCLAEGVPYFDARGTVRLTLL